MSQWLVGKLKEVCRNPRTRHYLAWAPPDEAGEFHEKQEFPPASILFIEETPGEGAYLFRYAADGSFAGDTWHMNIAEAKEQATYEFEDVPIAWTPVPSEIDDPISFGLSQLGDNLSEG